MDESDALGEENEARRQSDHTEDNHVSDKRVSREDNLFFQQRRKVLETQALKINQEDGCDVFVLYWNSADKGLYGYGTPGLAQTFIGTGPSKKPSNEGSLLIRLFISFAERYCSSRPTEQGISSPSTLSSSSSGVTSSTSLSSPVAIPHPRLSAPCAVPPALAAPSQPLSHTPNALVQLHVVEEEGQVGTQEGQEDLQHTQNVTEQNDDSTTGYALIIAMPADLPSTEDMGPNSGPASNQSDDGGQDNESPEPIDTEPENTNTDPDKIDDPPVTFSDSDLQVPTENVGKGNWVCKVCNRTFLYKSKLAAHLRVHSGERPFTCNICHKTFAISANVTRHLRVHTGEKPYKCKECGRAYAFSSDLTNHIRTHTGEKPYKCTYCPKAFARGSHLKIHIRIHTGEKPFQCKVCGKTFARSIGLKQHSRTHSGERPYGCDICGKRFTQSSNLTSHLRRHENPETYTCCKCEKTFSRSSNFKRHVCKENNQNEQEKSQPQESQSEVEDTQESSDKCNEEQNQKVAELQENMDCSDQGSREDPVEEDCHNTSSECSTNQLQKESVEQTGATE